MTEGQQETPPPAGEGQDLPTAVVAGEETKKFLLGLKTDVIKVRDEAVSMLKDQAGKASTEISAKAIRKLKKWKGRIKEMINIYGKDQVNKFIKHPILSQGVDTFLDYVDKMVTAVDSMGNIQIHWKSLVKLLIAMFSAGYFVALLNAFL